MRDLEILMYRLLGLPTSFSSVVDLTLVSGTGDTGDGHHVTDAWQLGQCNVAQR